MKIQLFLFVVLLFILTVNSRNVDDKTKSEDLSGPRDDQPDFVTRARERGASDLRHRRKRWQFGYGYNYPPPPPPYYDRRDDRNEQDLYPQILNLLEEISTYLKRPQQTLPQPIYVPYPVPYPVPQYHCSCPSPTRVNLTDQNVPDVKERWPDMEDTNQNWGIVSTEDVSDGGNDGTRPISFDPLPPKRKMQRTQPPVEHGSSQAGSDLTTQNPLSVRGLSQASPPRSPSRCDAAVLSCCGPSSSTLQQRKCFTNLGCEAYYNRGNACTADNVSSVLDSFTKAYSVSN